MSFMQPEIVYAQYYSVDTDEGTEIIPCDVVTSQKYPQPVRAEEFGAFIASDPLDENEMIEPRTGWLARLSAPGYLDATEWTVHATRKHAELYLVEQYGDEGEER